MKGSQLVLSSRTIIWSKTYALRILPANAGWDLRPPQLSNPPNWSGKTTTRLVSLALSGSPALHAHSHLATCRGVLRSDLSPCAHNTRDTRNTTCPCPLGTKSPEGEARPAYKAKGRWMFCGHLSIHSPSRFCSYRVQRGPSCLQMWEPTK